MALKTEVRVGLFVLVGLSVIGLVIFLIGDARQVFERKIRYQTTFSDVEGLVPGSLVRMGGVDIGRVDAVRFPDNAERADIILTISIVSRVSGRIRADSVAKIEAKGLLGDKLLAVTQGSADKPALAEDEFILSSPGDNLLSNLSGLGEKASIVVGNLEKTTGTFAEEGFRGDVRASATALRNFLESLESGEGYVPRLLRDKDEADKLSRAVSNLETTSQKLNSILAQVDTAVARVNRGPGFAHELIYGEEGARALAQFGQAAEEVALTLKGIREGDGLARQVLFGGDDANAGKIMDDLAAITGDLRVVTRQVREGKGTLGALLVDPSVYEDVKVLLGNVQRNDALRALVRYSIRRDEQRPSVEVRDPEPAPSREAELKK